ncbi:hypothetical protein JOF56_002779 [Kibdelosporangium banguiense]|uniref:Secreted protein n=1 Tax=Kibdelosporangium banguiense TaxID=1365924 RepID=A0ABS4TD92_9PSEU|nr:DUF6355 family natural product biosynthesis protein [Kibdelosporangium banguiense]MBP2322394.1 hypothetical protein [Kibdelosporangium banguiense]
MNIDFWGGKTMRLSRIATAVAALALAGTGVLATPASAAVDPCGYFERGNDGLYNHCPPDVHLVEVYIDYTDGRKGQTCVATGTTRIGSASEIYFAWSTRQRCRV